MTDKEKQMDAYRRVVENTTKKYDEPHLAKVVCEICKTDYDFPCKVTFKSEGFLEGYWYIEQTKEYKIDKEIAEAKKAFEEYYDKLIEEVEEQEELPEYMRFSYSNDWDINPWE